MPKKKFSRKAEITDDDDDFVEAESLSISKRKKSQEENSFSRKNIVSLCTSKTSQPLSTPSELGPVKSSRKNISSSIPEEHKNLSVVLDVLEDNSDIFSNKNSSQQSLDKTKTYESVAMFDLSLISQENITTDLLKPEENSGNSKSYTGAGSPKVLSSTAIAPMPADVGNKRTFAGVSSEKNENSHSKITYSHKTLMRSTRRLGLSRSYSSKPLHTGALDKHNV